MYLPANKFRLAHLRLDGFRPGTVVLFCPCCDFQRPFDGAAATVCPDHDVGLHSTIVTTDLMELVKAAA